MNIGLSDIDQYLIAHENDYQALGDSALVKFPVAPNLDIESSTNINSAFAFNDIYGRFHELVVNHRSVTPLEFTLINEEQVQEMEELIFGKMQTYGTRYYYVNALIRGLWRFTKVYIGTPIEVSVKRADNNSKIVIYKFDLIETDGTLIRGGVING